MPRFLRRLRARLRYRRFERDLAEEMAFHQAMKQRDWERTGLPPAEARLMAHRDMGNVTREREAARGIWIAAWLESVWQDIAYAARSLRRQPAYTLAAVAALVLGIGLNTSAFTYFNAVALRQWAVDQPSRVVQIHQVLKPRDPAGRPGNAGFSLAEFRYLRDRATTLAGVIAWRVGSTRLGHEELDRPTALGQVSANFFDVLGVDMVRGRGFTPDEDRLENPQAVVVISHRLWTRQFASDPAIGGRTIRLDDAPFVVVGVTPPEYTGTEPTVQDAWIPTAAAKLLRPADDVKWQRELEDMWQRPDYCCSYVAGRLAPGVSSAQAHAELQVLLRRFRTQWKGPWEFYDVLLVNTAWLSEPGMKRSLRTMFALMFAAVALVLLLACANVANLMLARGLARQREIAIRLSLGASRRRVVRQLLTEAFVLAAIAGAASVLVAYVVPGAMFRASVGPNTNLAFDVRPDAGVLAFTFGVSLVACLLFGLVPAYRSTRAPGLRAGRNADLGGRTRVRGLMLGVQVAIGVTLLACAALLARGVREAGSQHPGFRVDGVSMAALAFPRQAYDEPRVKAFWASLLEALRSDDILRRAALTRRAVLGSTRDWAGFQLLSDPADGSRARPMIQTENVSTGYFEVLQIPIVAGRAFQPKDDGRTVVMINETFARRYLADVNPVGQAIRFGRETKEVIGVARDAHTSGFDEVTPLFYSLFDGDASTRLLLRAGSADAAPPDAVVFERLKGIVQRVDQRVLVEAKPLAFHRERWLASSRFIAIAATAVGLLALALACVGVFGVFAYVVQERTREIGIRMAIGAQAPQVVRLVLGTTAWATIGGLLVGLAGAGLFATFLRGYLYGVGRFDPLAYGGVALVLTIAALIATYIPVRRATRVDPTTALRCD